ncbi:MAG TPA: hypothetical protein VNZ44_07835 [Pyrinomonadaceae bacterium]|nr:hypothetical protein [Pyrinomonadaceae bacterium]
MPSYVERFEAMVEEIKGHPRLEVVEFALNPPATADVFRQVEEKLKAAPSGPLREFYGRANGMRLRWKIKAGLSEAELEEVRAESPDYSIESSENADIPFAQINLIPLEEALVTRRWEEFEEAEDDEHFEFQGQTYLVREFGERVRPFDLFSTYNAMAFVTEEGNGDPPAMLLGDYYVEWSHSRLTDFASYVEMLLATRGVVKAREQVYGEYRGDLKPALKTGADYWTQERVPQLFRKR